MHFFDILVDIVRIGHLGGLALGIGLAIFLDIRTFQLMTRPLAQNDIDLIDSIHKIIFAALGLLWVTGLCLIYIRTEFKPDDFSPKLWAKLGVVIALTLNALLISRVVFPVLRQSVGKHLYALTSKQRLPMALIAANSAFCWAMALMLGASSVLKTAPWAVLIPVMIGLYLSIALIILGLSSRRWGTTCQPKQV